MFSTLFEVLLSRGWRWDRKDPPALMAPNGTIWLDHAPPWKDPHELLGVMQGRLERIRNAGPISDDVDAWTRTVSDTQALVDATRDVLLSNGAA
ncbi:MAG: hypothetical protein HS104_15615 [Polyangiaceae bacterium]|nr:hypothetical protein [Polyangiaceae bacterium]